MLAYPLLHVRVNEHPPWCRRASIEYPSKTAQCKQEKSVAAGGGPDNGRKDHVMMTTDHKLPVQTRRPMKL